MTTYLNNIKPLTDEQRAKAEEFYRQNSGKITAQAVKWVKTLGYDEAQQVVRIACLQPIANDKDAIVVSFCSSRALAQELGQQRGSSWRNCSQWKEVPYDPNPGRGTEAPRFPGGRLWQERDPGREEKALKLWCAVRRLPFRQRMVIYCRYRRGMTVAETCAKLGVCNGTYSTNLKRALAKLAKYLGSERPRKLQAKEALTAGGVTRTQSEWAEHLGITKQALSLRLQTMSLEQALSMPRQKRTAQWSAIGVTIDGQTRTIKQWCELKGLKYRLVSNRLRKGWDPATAITKPFAYRGRRE